MFYVYILESKRNKVIYIGYTQNVAKRIIEHNTNMSTATKNRGPYELVYFEAYKSKADALAREHNLKLRTNALSGLKRRLKDSLAEAR